MRKFSLLLLLCLFTAAAWAQQKNITGRVIDNSGAVIPFATVTETGSKNSVSADANGNFSITVASGSRLTFSAAGFEEQIISPSGATQDVTLIRTGTDLQEVVVTGVGTATSRRKLAIAVETVTSRDMAKVPSASIDQALVGKIAGAQIQSTSGQPGQQASILLRGINTLGSTQPMILVDGVQVHAGSNTNGSASNLSSRLSDLDLSNVERVEVVQGAAAATIYGAQGANGVIQIFTRRGARSGRPTITLNSRTSIDNVLQGKFSSAKNHFYATDAEGYILDTNGDRMQFDASTGTWTSPDASFTGTTVNNKPFKEKTYDQFDNLFNKNALTLNNSINIAGGRERMDYSFTLSNTNQESILFGDYKRTNLSLNIGTELFKNFNLRSLSQVIFSDNKTGGITGQNDVNSALASALLSRQWWDLRHKDSTGSYVANPELDNSVNPFYNNEFREYSAKNTRIIQGIQLNYKPVKYLELDYKYGIDNYRFDYREFIKYQLNTANPGIGIDPFTGSLTLDRDNQTLQNSLLTLFVRTDFQKDFGWRLPLQTTTQLAYDWRKDNYENVQSVGAGFGPFPPYSLSNASSQSVDQTNTDFITYGYLANQRLDYGNLFGVSGGVRVDYSSAFGSGNEAFVFPRGDAYFRLSELFKSNFINELKVRGAYGEAGIQPGAYDRFITLNSGNIGSASYLALKGTANNPLLNVEVSKETEVGVDAIFRPNSQQWFNDIRLSATYWRKSSEDVIRAIDLAPSSGTLGIITNAIDLSSKGFQFSLDSRVLDSKKFTWNFGTRFGRQKSKVDKIVNGKDITIGSGGSGEFVLREGESIGAFFGVKPLSSIDETNSAKVRIIPEAEAGNYEVVNGMVVNKTTKAVKFTSEKFKIGDPTPKFNMSFINNFSFLNGFSAALQVDWVYGNQVYNQTKQWLFRDLMHSEFDKEITVGGTSGAYVSYYNSLYNTNTTNAYFVEDGSFVRLRDLSLSYDFKPLLKKIDFVRTLQLSLSGRNLFTITDYTGFDPEAAANLNDPTQRGLDLWSFPNFRSFQAGLTIGF